MTPREQFRATAMLRSRMKREQRQEARKLGITTKRLQRERLRQQVNEAFTQMQRRVVPHVVELKVRED